MSVPGGGQVDIEQLLRQLGPEPLLRELEAAGCPVKAKRARCPFPECAGKDTAKRNLQVFIEGKPHVFCFACGAKGDLLDLLELIRRMSKAEAIAYVRGQPAPMRPPLQLVREPRAAQPDDDEKLKLKPEEVKRIWEALARSDPAAERYLAGRRLEDAVGLGLVRFATTKHPDKRVTSHARRGYHIALLLTDVVGNLRGVQIRLARKTEKGEDPWMSVKGSAPGRAFYGAPDLIESSPIVCVTEGGADTLAVAVWTAGSPGVAVVGVAGISNIHKLARELEAAGIPVADKLFLLFTQNDQPLNKSRRAFEQLRQVLVQRGARAVHVALNPEVKDVAELLQRHPDSEWPPPDVQQAFALGSEGDDGPAAPRLIEPSRGALPIAPRYEPEEHLEADLASLVSLLDDPGHREALMGRRWELAFNEMTGELNFGGRELDETDITMVRLNAQQYRNAHNKRLKFPTEDIGAALHLLSKRRKVHPIRDWLNSLRWDGVDRFGEWLADVFGVPFPSLEAHLLRKWFLSAAARGIEPGCKVDTVLVLVGPEGLRKTTFFQMMAGVEYFTSSVIKIGEADGYSALRYNWIVEWGELDSMRRARDQESIKNFLSSPHDFYRPKWGRSHQRIMRSCVIVGTTNPKPGEVDGYARFLQGDSNRRFWPVKVDRIDFDALSGAREQLWAQAAHLYHAAFECLDCSPLLPLRRCEEHRWYLEEHYSDVLKQHHTKFAEQDEWLHVIRDFLDEKLPSTVTVHGLLQAAIHKEPGQWGQRDTERVAAALRALGWTKSDKRRLGGAVGVWWIPPAAGEPAPQGDHP